MVLVFVVLSIPLLLHGVVHDVFTNGIAVGVVVAACCYGGVGVVGSDVGDGVTGIATIVCSCIMGGYVGVVVGMCDVCGGVVDMVS